MPPYIATLENGDKYLVYIVDFKEDMVIVETVDGRQFEVSRNNVMLT